MARWTAGAGERGLHFDGEAEHRHVVLFREAEVRRNGILGGLEGAVERRQGNFEVDGVVALDGLDEVVIVEDGFLVTAFESSSTPGLETCDVLLVILCGMLSINDSDELQTYAQT